MGGVVTLKQFFDAAKTSEFIKKQFLCINTHIKFLIVTDCNTANTDQPLMCLDLTIISVLLRDGFGLDMNTKLNVSI